MTLDQHSRIARDIDDMNIEFLVYSLFINEKLFSKLF